MSECAFLLVVCCIGDWIELRETFILACTNWVQCCTLVFFVFFSVIVKQFPLRYHIFLIFVVFKYLTEPGMVTLHVSIITENRVTFPDL